jgi:DNA-binding beta-propeller fold protein YncE
MRSRIGSKLVLGAATLIPALLPLGAAADQGTLLATGQTVTATAASGSRFIELNPGLIPGTPLLPNQLDASHFIAGQEKTTVLSPDGTTLLVLTSGFNRLADANGNGIPEYSNEYVFVFTVASGQPALRQVLQVPNTFDGMAFAPDGKTFYVSGGVDNNVHVFALGAAGWAESGAPIALGTAPVFPNGGGAQAAGLAVNGDGTRLVIANYESDSISIIDTAARSIVATLDLRPGKLDQSSSGVPGGEFPYWVAIAGNSTAFVSSIRDREIVVVDFASAPRVAARIAVHGNPNRMLLSRAQTRLYVASDNADTVEIIDTHARRVIGRVNTTAPAGALDGTLPTGSSPNSLALSPDERTLYVTNGGANALAVIALNAGGQAQVRGLIPTGWYPNSVSVSRDGRTLYVVNGKSKEGPNPHNCTRPDTDETLASSYPPGCAVTNNWNGAQNQYILQESKGGLLVIPTPGRAELTRLTAAVASNDNFALALSGEERRVIEGLRRRIQHVIYIVKENRTYDQILGDLAGTNGDSDIAQFPQAITPNFHALAKNFVALDNFSCSGDVSMDGWQWSTGARTTDANEKAYIVNYSGRGLSYDSEGDVRNIISVWHTSIAARQLVDPSIPNDPDLLPGPRNEVELDGPAGELGAGYLWDAALRAGKTLRNYGMFVDEPAGVALLGDPRSQNIEVAVPSNAALDPYTDKFYRGWETCVPDFYREQEWATEFDQYAAKSDQAGKDMLPSLSLVRLPQDHMGCFGKSLAGVDVPETQQADNDYAVGRLIEKVAASRFANNTLIFVLEDDAQDGPDHVDARRSTGYVVGPYVRHGAVVSTPYNTVSMLRTIEDLLGLEHLNLHDSGARPMTDVFDLRQSEWTFTAVPSRVLRSATTLPLPAASAQELALRPVKPTHDGKWWARATKDFNFRKEDMNNAGRFNRVLWQGLMGDKPYPVRAAAADKLALERD